MVKSSVSEGNDQEIVMEDSHKGADGKSVQLGAVGFQIEGSGRRSYRGYLHCAKALGMWDVCCERTVSSEESEPLDFLFLDHRNGLHVAGLGNPAKNYGIVQ